VGSGFASPGDDPFGDGLGMCAAMITDHNPCTAARESDRGGLADAAAAAGDEEHLSGQSEHR